MRKKILILDDKAPIAQLLNMYLSEEFECIYFDNPRKGIQWLIGGGAPDLIISDIKMPEMRGDEFLSYIRHNELFKSIPIIILTRECRQSERLRLLAEGADDFIVKPFNPLDLKSRIKKILH